MAGKKVSREATNMMSKNSLPAETSSTTKTISPMIIKDASAMLPNEIRARIFEYTDYHDLSNLKIVSDNFNAIATRSLNIRYKSYELCREKAPERHWCEILERARHPINDRIDCEDFHAEKGYQEIWKFLLSTWTEWSTMINKQPEVQRLTLLNPDDSVIETVGNGNIIARTVVDFGGETHFYDVLRLIDGSIFSLSWTCNSPRIILSKKGANVTVTGVEISVDGTKTMKTWDVKSRQLIMSMDCVIKEDTEIFTCASFGYTCLIGVYVVSCTVKIVQESTGSSRETRLTFGIANEVLGVEAHGDTLMILVGYMAGDHVFNDSYVSLYNISIRECRLNGIHKISVDIGMVCAEFLLFKPCVVATYLRKKIGFSVSGRNWKFYNTKKHLKLEAPITGAAYECGVLVLMMRTGNIHMIYADDPDHLDSKLETMPSRTVTLSWNNVNRAIVRNPVKIFFTEYDSKIYLIVSTVDELVILKFR